MDLTKRQHEIFEFIRKYARKAPGERAKELAAELEAERSA